MKIHYDGYNGLGRHGGPVIVNHSGHASHGWTFLAIPWSVALMDRKAIVHISLILININQIAAYAVSSLFWDTRGECQPEVSTLRLATM